MKYLVVLVSFYAVVQQSRGLGGNFGNVGAIGGMTPPPNNGGYQGGGFGGGGIGGFGGGGSFPPIQNMGGGLFGVGGGGGAGFGGPGFGGGGGDNSNFGGGGGGGGEIVKKFVSVFVGADEPEFTQTKVIRAGGPPERHVNIIFVKAPSSTSTQQNTEVILPEVPTQKTLVYILVKKQEHTNDVRVRGPALTKPSKPEVYFIRYKQGGDGGAQSAGPGSGSLGGPPSGSFGAFGSTRFPGNGGFPDSNRPASSYGAP